MNSIKKIALTLSVLLALLASDAFAQCANKVVHIQLPSGWGSTTYMLWEGAFTAITGERNGEWTTFTLPAKQNDGPAKEEIVFSDQNTYNNQTLDINTITKLVYNKGKDLISTGKFLCSDFGAEGTWIMEDPGNPGKTAVSTQPPNARYFYFLPPKEDEWILNAPYLAIGNTTPKPMDIVGEKCGWFKKVYFNEPVPNQDARVFQGRTGTDKIGIMGTDEDPMDWGPDGPRPFNLKEMFDDKFGVDKPGSLYFVAQDGAAGWTTFDPNRIDKSRCEYKFAAKIYFKGTTGNSFSHHPNGTPEGICRGYVKKDLDASDPDPNNWKMVWNGRPAACANKDAGWLNEIDFNNAFKSTPGQNTEICYDMPFEKRPSGLWEFDAFYMCPDGSTMDYNSTATVGCTGAGGPGSMGGFYLPSSMVSTLPGTTYGGDRVSVPDSVKWCYDRGWYGTGKGDLTGKTTKAEINAEMQRVCIREFRDGEILTGGDPIQFDWGTGRAGVKGLLCFASSPAEFVYVPGQEFFFRGDDDIWVFINKKLVVDLGGNHIPAPGYVNLDTLGLTEGEKYPLNIFFCDRRAPGSNVRITTNMYFSQKNGLMVDKGNGKDVPAEICIQQDGGNGSCAGLAGGGAGGKLCGGAVSGKIAYYLISRSGTRIDLTNDRLGTDNDNCVATGNAGEFKCYGGIKVNVNNGVASVDMNAGVSLSGTWYLYVRVIPNSIPPPLPEDEKITTISAKSNVKMAWGNIVEGETQRPLTNICKKDPVAVTGELVPICISAGTPTNTGFEAGYVDDIGGTPFKLNTTGFRNSLGFNLKVFYDSLGTNPVSVNDNLMITSASGAAAPKLNSGSVPGVLVLWVTGDYNQDEDPDYYTINVTGGTTAEEVKLTSRIPKLQWVKADFQTEIPAADQQGSQWNIEGDPTSGVLMDGGKPKPVWVGETIKLYLRALTYTGKTCTTCTFDLELKASADGRTETDGRLIGSSGLRIKEGIASLEISGKKDVQDPNYAQITVGSLTSTVAAARVAWTKLQFAEPPVPYPDNVRIFNVDGDGIGDSLVIAYNRGYDPDSLPNMIEAQWGDPKRDTTLTFGIGNGRQTSDGLIYERPDDAANLNYWAQYICNGGCAAGRFLSVADLNARRNLTGDEKKELKDTIILRGKFSKEVLTKSEIGKINNWVTFKTGEREYNIPLNGSIEDRIPAIIVSARYAADDANKGCGTVNNPCYDKITIELSEPVKLDPAASSTGNDKRKNVFAYKLRDLDKDALWDVLKPEDVDPSAVRWLNGPGDKVTPGDNDSIVNLYYYRFREGDAKSGTPMPGDSVKFAALWKYAGFAQNMLVDHNGNEPNPNEIGRQLEGRKPYTPEKIPIGEINPNNPGYYVDKIRETLDNNGSRNYGTVFPNDRPVELLPVPPDWTINDIKREYPGTIGMLFNPDLFNSLSDLEDTHGPINDGDIIVYPRAFFHTNLGNYVADNPFEGGIRCNDKIFPIGDKGQPSCRDSRSKFYIAWDMKDMKGRFVGAGAYVGIYDFRWEVYINSTKSGYTGTVKMDSDTIERQIEMHGVKRVKKVQ